MPGPGSIARSVAIALIAAVAVACTTSSSSPPASRAVMSPSAPAAASPTASPSAGGASIESPPDAVLAVDGGDPVEGQLGTYVWAGGGSDSPWLPGAPIAATTGEVLSVTLSPDLDVSGWSAVVAPANSPDGSGRVEAGSGPGPVQVVVPDAGAWTLALTVRFGDLGSATWFWRLDVS